jgi:SAM-dependent methyltransferase
LTSPEDHGVRAAITTVLRRSALIEPVRRARDIARALPFARSNLPYLLHGAPDGLPIPPASLRILVAASPEIAWFFESGRRGAECIRSALERNGIDFHLAGPVLDFGCGCGRVLRHFATDGIELYGADINPRLVKWCERHLRGTFVRSGIAPPLPFDDAHFGLVYAFSVFTHLPESLQAPWMSELRRVVRPSGYLLVSTHGDRYLDALTPAQRARFLTGELVVTRDDRPGANVCGAYHPPAYVRDHLARGFRVMEFAAAGATGNPWQDLWVLQRE